MTKTEKRIILKSLITILAGYRDNSQDIVDYLESDITMQFEADLEAIRKNEYPLPMSGIYI